MNNYFELLSSNSDYQFKSYGVNKNSIYFIKYVKKSILINKNINIKYLNPSDNSINKQIYNNTNNTLFGFIYDTKTKINSTQYHYIQ